MRSVSTRYARIRGTATLPPLVLGCLAATWLIWGSTYLAIKLALANFPPFLQVGTRFLAAGSALFLWANWRGHSVPTVTQWRNAMIVGTLMLATKVGGVAYAEQSVPSSLVVAFIAVVPALITLAGLPFGIKPTRIEVSGIGLGIVGVLLLVRSGTFAASPAGLTAISVAALGWSIGSVLSQHVTPLAPAPAGYASAMIRGGVVLMVLSLLAGETVHWPLQPLAAIAWTYLAVFGSTVAFSAYMVLLKSTTPAIASSNCPVNPWVAVGVIVLSVTMVLLGR